MAPHAPENQIGIYKLKRWTWYEKQIALRRATIILDSEKGISETPLQDFNLHMLNVCLIEAPFGRGDLKEDIKNIKQLDVDVGDRLQDVCQELNEITRGEKAGF